MNILRPCVLSSYLFGVLSYYAWRKTHKLYSLHILLLAITSICHHSMYEQRSWRSLDKKMVKSSVFHSFIRCTSLKEIMVFLCITSSVIQIFDYIKKHPAPNREWNNIEDLIPHLLMHLHAIVGIWASVKFHCK